MYGYSDICVYRYASMWLGSMPISEYEYIQVFKYLHT